MNVKDYIDTGILERYALGLLNEAEARDVEATAREYPAIRQTLNEYRETMAAFSQAYSVTPPAHLREKVVRTDTEVQKKTHSRDSAKMSKARPWAIAASVLLLISLAFNFFQQQRSQEMRENLNATELEIAEMESRQQVIMARFEKVRDHYQILRDTATVHYVMKPADGQNENYRADIFWNTREETAYLDIKNLPAPPPGSDYQLWALKDDEPTDLGIFRADLEFVQLQQIGPVPAADAFVITLETAGGSEQPAMDEVVLRGKPVSFE